MKQENSFKWLPAVIEEFCTGCGLCVEACEPACLETQSQVAVLERPDDCGSEEHCVSVCPEDAIHMVWLPAGGRSINWYLAPVSTHGLGVRIKPRRIAHSNQIRVLARNA